MATSKKKPAAKNTSKLKDLRPKRNPKGGLGEIVIQLVGRPTTGKGE